MVPADSRRITRVPRYSGYHYAKRLFEYGTITLYGGPFQNLPLDSLNTMTWSYNPYHALLRHRFGLFPVRSPLLGESFFYFLFLEVLRCFSSLRLPSCISQEWRVFNTPGCPIRKSLDQRLFAPTQSLSQLITSFFASVSQGIRHAPFLTFFAVKRFPDYYQL